MERLFSPDNPVIRFLGRVCDLMILSVLFTLSCMLIAPSGAAMTALYTMTLRMVRNEEGETIKGYFIRKESIEMFRELDEQWRQV